MGLLADWQIRELCIDEHGAPLERAMIRPFHSEACRPGIISWGCSSYGYDVRVGYKFKVFTNVYGAIIDPKGLRPDAFVDVDLTPTIHAWRDDADEEPSWTCSKCRSRTSINPRRLPPEVCGVTADHIVIPPNSFALAETVEYFEIPRNILAVCLGKSTYARAGIVVNVTPLEPEWRGKITLEISNTTPLPAKIYANEGLCQLLFFKTDEVCEKSYADKKGRYQDQAGLTLPFVVGQNLPQSETNGPKGMP